VSGIEAKKLMGFLLTECDTKINPKRCALTRYMSVLSGFASVGGGGSLPYQEGKEVFIKLKKYLASPSVMCKPQPSTPLSLYLAVIHQAISSVLIQEEQDQFQNLICFVSKIWQEPEERYQVPEKATLLVSRQLSPIWTGSSRVTGVLGNKACRLETLKGGAIPRTWNAANFNFYLS